MKGLREEIGMADFFFFEFSNIIVRLSGLSKNMGVFEHQLEVFEEQLKKVVERNPIPTLTNVLQIMKSFANEINQSMEQNNKRESKKKLYQQLLTKYRKQVFVGPKRSTNKPTMVVKPYQPNVVTLD